MHRCLAVLLLAGCAAGPTIVATPAPDVGGHYSLSGPLTSSSCGASNACATSSNIDVDVVVQSSGSIEVFQAGSSTAMDGTDNTGALRYVIPPAQANVAGCVATMMGVATISAAGGSAVDSNRLLANGTLSVTYTPPCDGSNHPSCYCTWTLGGARSTK